MTTIGRVAVFGGLLLALGAGGPAWAQVTFTFNLERPLSAIPKTEAEFDAFLLVQAEMNAERRLRMANDFLADFSDSEFRHLVLRFRFQARYELGDWEETIPAIEEGLAAEEIFREGKLGLLTDPEELDGWPVFALDMANQKMVYHQSLAEGYQATGDLDNALLYAEMTLEAQDEVWALYEEQNDPASPEFQDAEARQDANREFILRAIYSIHNERRDVPNLLAAARNVLEVAPGDVEMLMRVSQIMTAEVPEDPALRGAHLEEAEFYGGEAITALEAWAQSDVSADIAESQKAGLIAQAYSNLGMVHFQTGNYEGAAEAFGGAVEKQPDNGALHYQLGVVHNNRQNVEAAVESLARAVYLGFNEARPALESVFQAMNGTLEGIDEFVDAQGRQLSGQ